MCKKKTRKLLFLSLGLLLLLLLIKKDEVRAADDVASDCKMLDNGNFWFQTTDTTATTSTTWRTIGFTVRRDRQEDGNPRKDDNYVYFWLQDGQKVEVPHPDGTTTVTFNLTKKQVNKALTKKGFETIKTNDVLYLNGIFKVSNGKKVGPFYTLNDITNAENWKNKDDFADRFNKKIYYNAGYQTYPVTITSQLYQSGSYKTIEKKKVAELHTHDEFKTDYTNIEISKTEGKQKYYLYRVYYQNLKDTTKLGNRKTEINPNINNADYLNEIKSYVRDRSYYMQGAEDGDSLNIVAIYRRFPTKDDTENADEITKDYEEIDPTGVIKADARGNEAYDVADGIPGTETVYANAFTSKYMAGSTFIRKYGTKVYNVKVSVTYELSWEEKDPKTGKPIPRSQSVPKDYYYQVEREYSYWIIKSLGVYALDKATINNGSLPGGSVTLNASGYNAPTVNYVHNDAEKDHLIEPVASGSMVSVSLGSVSVKGSTVPDYSYKSNAEDAVNQIKCKNDSLTFNGATIMSAAVQEKKTATPTEIPSGLDEVGENVLYRSNIMIPGTMANGKYESSGTVYYKPVKELNPAPVELETEINEINSVTVHTPVVCDGMVQDNRSDNQMISPDAGKASLVLDRPFYVTLPTTGLHRFIQGYGYRDYAKYTASRQVKFAFDVYTGSSTAGTFVPKNTWTSVSENTQFYVPTWVPEGLYEIRFRSTAINAAANNATEAVESLANLSLENYVAEDSSIVQISGRIYGLNIYDVTDYPIWEKVFRLPDSLKMTGFKYTVGTKDQNGDYNGRDSKYTLTMVNGSHPNYINQGILKTGYMTRFSLTTVGSMAEDNDYVRIQPTFYYVDKNGQNRRPVDIYYSETFNGKENVMVKMGGNIDLQNDKTIRTGDPYLAIPDEELQRTAYFEGTTLQHWKAQEKKIYNFMNIMLPSSLRTFIGTVNPIPQTVTEKQVASSVQHWYGEYYLPAEVHVAPKGFDVTDYAVHHGGLDYHENFWLKDGYIIVNFDITTVEDGKLNLSYINQTNSPNGYCNMWNREGYQYQKQSYGGAKFNFQDGDYVIYYANKNVNEDWTSSGTH